MMMNHKMRSRKYHRGILSSKAAFCNSAYAKSDDSDSVSDIKMFHLHLLHPRLMTFIPAN